MNLVIDIGNSKTKLALFRDDEIESVSAFDTDSAQKLKQELKKLKKVNKCIICSVSDYPVLLKSFVECNDIKTLELNSSTPLPFKNSYKTKETLGKDRLAAVAGAYKLYPNQDVLVIDAGTAITFDLLTNEGIYSGGNISPGLNTRFNALHKFTSRLPLLNPSKTMNFLGNTTEEAIINGVQNGLIFELNGYIETLISDHPELVVILTGGDAQFFDNKLKKPIFVDSNLTLKGLNFILEYNAQTF
ncbi:MAG: type III pantothenate kinase [Bacteroidales bacterium]|nr:type III pantothenate kinase [Bacteroidales bacterium]